MSKMIPKLPDEFLDFIKTETTCDVTLFGDSGNRYRVVKLYDEQFHDYYSTHSAGKMSLPTNCRPLATLKNSRRILCMYHDHSLALVSAGNYPDADKIRINVSEFLKLLKGEDSTLFLPGNKQRHIVAVAEYMYRNAEKYGLIPEEMYVLGLLHDVGYLYGNVAHSMRGGHLLHSQDYKYWQEIYHHGKFQDEYESAALSLLNEADLMVDSNGRVVGFDVRLKDIKERYGEDSNNYIYSKKLVEKIRN